MLLLPWQERHANILIQFILKRRELQRYWRILIYEFVGLITSNRNQDLLFPQQKNSYHQVLKETWCLKVTKPEGFKLGCEAGAGEDCGETLVVEPKDRLSGKIKLWIPC